ncbi:MAG: hypothetical protein ACI4CX_02530 [Candidatus Weimeria sp.]|jgi:hypothetical protein
MKKKIVSIIICVAVLGGCLGITRSSKADLNNIAVFKNLQSQNVTGASLSDVAVTGKNTEITNKDLNDAMKYYMANGESSEKAKEDALEYLEEYNALYVQAKNKGYSVTEKEVDDYLAGLKADMETAENKSDIKAIIAAYGNEDDYWKHLKKVYMKALVVMKYTKDLESDFAKNYSGEKNSTEYSDAWDKEFSQIKADAVKSENYKE